MLLSSVGYMFMAAVTAITVFFAIPTMAEISVTDCDAATTCDATAN